MYFTSHFPFCSISIATTAVAPGRRNRDRQKIHVPLPFSLPAPPAGKHTAPAQQMSLALLCSGCQRCGGCWKATQNSHADKAWANGLVFGVSLQQKCWRQVPSAAHPVLTTHLMCPTLPPCHFLLQPQGTTLLFLTLKEKWLPLQKRALLRFFTSP